MEVVGIASQSTRWIAVESVGPQTLRALLAGAAVVALTVYIISEPAIAYADNSGAHAFARSGVAVFADQSPAQAVGRIMPIDDTDNDEDWTQQQLQNQLQADQQMQEAEQEAEEQNELAEQEAQQAEQQGELTEQEANLQVP
jgi:hypothetical protein